MNTLVEKHIKYLEDKTFFVPAILEDEETFEEFRVNMYQMFKDGFEVKELREAPAKFIFKLDEEPHEMQVRRFYINLLMWYPLCLFGCPNDIDESFIVDDFTAGARINYFNEKIFKPYVGKVENSLINFAVLESLHMLQEIAIDFNVIMGGSMNLLDYVKLSNTNTKFNDLINTELDPNEQSSVNETIMENKLTELISILKTTKNPLKDILNAGKHIKDKQLIEYFISIGYKSTFDGKTIPQPVSSNFLKGMKSPSDYYIECNSAMKSVLANFEKMGDAGSWQKKMMNLCSEYRLHPTIKECNSVRPLEVNVKTEKHLKALSGMYRVGIGGRKIPIRKSDKYLIGKKILIKSPLTCGCKDGYICETCYGELSKININKGIGALAAAMTTEPVSQNVLSTKHLNRTDSEIITFKDGFDSIFILNSNEIFTKLDIEKPLRSFNIIIDKDSILSLSADDEDLEMNKYVLSFKVKDTSNGEIIDISTNGDKKPLFLSPELRSYMSEFCDENSDKYIINLGKLNEYAATLNLNNEEDEEDDEKDDFQLRLFILEIINNEATKPFYEIMNLFKNYNGREEDTIEWLNQRIFDKLLDAGINQPAVFSQILIKPLLRKASNKLEYPNFNGVRSAQDYQILNIQNAFVYNPSVLIGLASISVEKQLEKPSTFKKKAPGFMDPFFRK